MKRAHRMPFGAERAGGGASFRLWAPACESVELLLGRDPKREYQDKVADIRLGSH